MRILYLAPYLPSDAAGHGGADSTFALLEALAGRHQIRVLCYAEECELPRRRSLEALGVEVDCVLYERAPGRRALLPALAGGLRALRQRVPFWAAKYDQPGFRRRLRAHLAELRPELLHAELPLAALLSEGAGCGRVLSAYALPSRLRAGARARGAHGARGRMVQRLGRYELRILASADAALVVTREDEAWLRALGCSTPLDVGGAAVPLPDRALPAPQPDTLGFAASFDFEPNREALEALLQEILCARSARR